MRGVVGGGIGGWGGVGGRGGMRGRGEGVGRGENWRGMREKEIAMLMSLQATDRLHPTPLGVSNNHGTGQQHWSSAHPSFLVSS